jgi:Holliday junction resolvase RusA-like endonuclease
MIAYRVTVEGEIPGWQRAGHSGHHYTQDKTREIEARIKSAAKAQGADPVLTGEVWASAKVFFSIPEAWPRIKKMQAVTGKIRPAKKPDCDNQLKAILDALNGVAWKDDAQVVEAKISKFYAERPGAVIEFGPLHAA